MRKIIREIVLEQTILHVRRVSFRNFERKSRFSNRNSYSRSERHLSILVAPVRRRHLYRCQVSSEIVCKANRGNRYRHT